MSAFSELQDRMKTRLGSLMSLNAGLPVPLPIIAEDREDLASMVDEALGRLGCSIVVGQPNWANTQSVATSRQGDTGAQAQYKITIIISIGENPTVNRSASGTMVPCMDIAQLVTRRLQGFKAAGFTPLLVVSGQSLAIAGLQAYQLTLTTTAVFDPA